MSDLQTEILLADCVITDDRRRVLLIHRNTPELTQWELPGGKVESGESVPKAAKREMREELGVKVRVGKEVARVVFTQLGRNYSCAWLLAEIVEGEPVVQEPSHDACQYIDLSRYGVGALGFSPNVEELARRIQNDEIVL